MPDQISERVWGEVEKKLYCFSSQRETRWAPANKIYVYQPQRTWCGFYNRWFRGEVWQTQACSPLTSPQVVLHSWWLSLVLLNLPQMFPWLFLHWLAIVGICPLELREDHGGRGLAQKKQGAKGPLGQEPQKSTTRFQSHENKCKF